MLQILYILAFTILAVLAIGNLIRNMFTLGVEVQRPPQASRPLENLLVSPTGAIAHPELLDETGKLTTEPLMVMRSMSVDDARDQLDAIYESSPGYDPETSED